MRNRYRHARACPLKAAALTEYRALVEIKPLDEADPAAVETLLDDAFGMDRHGRTAYRLRDGCEPIGPLSLSAWDGSDLVGTLQSWPVAWVDAHNPHRRVALVMVGPVAVRPALQLGGIGRMLMDRMIASADAGADGALMMIGDPEYYGRFWDFSADATLAWEIAGPVERRRLLARAVPGRHLPAAAGMIVADPERRAMQAAGAGATPR